MIKRIIVTSITLFFFLIVGCKTPAPPQEGDDLSAENESMKRRMEILEENIYDLEARIDKKNDEIKLLKMENELQEKDKNDLSDSLAATQGELEEKIVALVEERDVLNAELAKLTVEKESLKGTVGVLEGTIRNLKKAIDEKNAEIKLLNTVNDSLGKTNKELSDTLTATKGDLETKNAELLKEREKLNNELAELIAERDKLQESMAREAARLKEIYDSIKKKLENEIKKDEIEILQYEGVLIVNIKNNVLFAPDSPVLVKKYEPVLKIIAEFFNKVPEKIIRVEGHTASVSKSKYETSWQLGAERSLNVVRFFQEKCKVDPQRLVLLSFGEYRPYTSNATEDGRIKNRRVQIVLIDRPLYQVKELKEVK